MRADASDASASPPSESSEVVAVCVCSPVDTFRLGDIEASPLVVNTILKDANLLKDQNDGLSLWPHDEDAQYHYNDSFITMDRTLAQQEERRTLVVELKRKIASEPLKKWIIKFGKIIAVGDYIKNNS